MNDSPLDALPPDYGDVTVLQRVRAAIAASGRTLVALDDDPTGVQTVHDTPVLARWSVPDLTEVLRERRPLFFILTNSRSLAEGNAVRLNREIVTNLGAAASRSGTNFAVASRSDSTLRGHFPAETDAIASVLGDVDGVLLIPAFFAGGRYTIDDVHWVRDGERLVPAAETEFARDPTFGYTHSNLKDWAAEKSGGRIDPRNVASIGIAAIRGGGPERVAAILGEVTDGRVVVVNAASERDLDVVALAVLRTEAAGKRFIYRTGASFVRARAGIASRPLLTRAELLGTDASAPLSGLVVVGSHVHRTSEQLTRLLDTRGVVGTEVSVSALLASPASRQSSITAARAAIDATLELEQIPVLFTSRAVVIAVNREVQLDFSRAVSAALVEIVGSIEARPGWIVAKGGITASDIGTEALGTRRALVLGQIRPGIPVWQLGPETRYPGLPYIVFPGNVGNVETLAEVVSLLRG